VPPLKPSSFWAETRLLLGCFVALLFVLNSYFGRAGLAGFLDAASAEPRVEGSAMRTGRECLVSVMDPVSRSNGKNCRGRARFVASVSRTADGGASTTIEAMCIFASVRS
jgi:hypothetical protein